MAEQTTKSEYAERREDGRTVPRVGEGERGRLPRPEPDRPRHAAFRGRGELDVAAERDRERRERRQTQRRGDQLVGHHLDAQEAAVVLVGRQHNRR